MIVVWGHRPFGRVDEYRGQYAHTVFFHIYMVPIAPVASAWMTRDGYGVPLPLQGRSVLAAYLRWCVPLPALGLFAIAPGVITAILGLALLAASAWSWTWRSLRASARKRSDFNLLAFGMRCEPSRLSHAQRAALANALNAKWQASGAKRPPEDVARFGAATLDEAVVAYGLLRLAAIEHGDGDQLADRLLESSADLAVSHGPYRDGAQLGPPRDDGAAQADNDLARAVAARMYAPPHPVRVYSAPPVQSSEHLFSHPRMKLAAAAICALFAAVGFLGFTNVLLPRASMTLSDLTLHPTSGTHVSVHCDAIERVGEIERDRVPVFACHLADRLLLVVGHQSAKDLDVDGTLQSLDMARFHTEEIRADPQYLDVYVEVGERWIQPVIVAFSIACVLASIVLVVIAIRQWRKNIVAGTVTAA